MVDPTFDLNFIQFRFVGEKNEIDGHGMRRVGFFSLFDMGSRVEYVGVIDLYILIYKSMVGVDKNLSPTAQLTKIFRRAARNIHHVIMAWNLREIYRYYLSLGRHQGTFINDVTQVWG